MKQRKSPTQICIDHLIYQPTKRSRSKRKPIPPASEVKTHDHVYNLLKAKWDRMRRPR
ncbi:NinE family protein [Erwiniaceae bacterium L1_55_4]|nr:NinE family protein [Erwiniaceae bacterium L1_55_4]